MTTASSSRFGRPVTLALVIVLSGPPLWPLHSQTARDNASNPQVPVRGGDPCDLLPDPSGNAYGLTKHCLDVSGSRGIARGDFNGDGFADLAVGVPFEDLVVTTFDPGAFRFVQKAVANAGGVNIIYGSAGGLTNDTTVAPAPQFWTQGTGQIGGIGGLPDTAEAGDAVGTAIASGDFNGDTFVDLAVAVPGEVTPIPGTSSTASGAIQILYGSPSGLSSSATQFFRSDQLGLSGVGNSLAWGDFDGDGFGDLVIEGSRSDPRVAVLFGSSLGLNGGRTRQTIPIANATFDFGESGGVLGDLTLTAGKLSGDPFDDLVVGTPFTTVSGKGMVGAVQVFFGSGGGLTAADQRALNQDTAGIREVAEAGDVFGTAVAVGDFNADGIPDLAVGVPGEDNAMFSEAGLIPNLVSNGGAVNVIFGPITCCNGPLANMLLFEATAARSDRDAEVGDRNGSSLAAGDFNGDGVADLAVGAPSETLGGAAGAGSVTVFHGSPTSGLTFAQFWTDGNSGGGTAAGDNFGASLSAWNFGRNQVILGLPTRTVRAADLAIGIPGKDFFQCLSGCEGVNTFADAGAVRVIYGGSSGLSVDNRLLNAVGPSQLWTQDAPSGTGGIGFTVPGQLESGDRFGSAVY